ncbi:hypothetical protein F5X98DRAFT_336164 [Xylaria grammica]|nr:hypothetical protein F5X98DRAFT_336164 [Xylaria grammica]
MVKPHNTPLFSPFPFFFFPLLSIFSGLAYGVGCGKADGMMHSGPQIHMWWMGSTVGKERICTGTGRANGCIRPCVKPRSWTATAGDENGGHAVKPANQPASQPAVDSAAAA